jgi:DNA-binding NarL/FixJ family response regulator
MSGSETIHVLLAAAHRGAREHLRQLLRDEGDPGLELVGEANDGRDLLARCRGSRPDVILLADELSEAPLGELVHNLSRSSPRTRVIVVSADPVTAGPLTVVRAGADAYLLRRIRLGQLIRAIASGGEERPCPPGPSPEATGRKRVEDRSGWERLTVREREVLVLVSQGLRNREIGNRLFISEKTVRNHLSSIFRKLGVADRTHAAILAVRRDLEDGKRLEA